MKFTSAFIALAAAADTQAPVISLNLDAGDHDHSGLTAVADARAEHALSHKDVNTEKVHVCAAKSARAGIDCALPEAKAYDHHDGSLAVSEDIYLVRSAGVDQTTIAAARRTALTTLFVQSTSS